MNFCTYFDSAYALKGWVCYKTLIEKSPMSKLFVLALDEKVLEQAKKLSNVISISLKDIENYYPTLLTVKNKRLPKEYYATITPILPLYIFDKYNIDKLFYTDADMAFWSEPEEMETVMGDYSLMVVDHGFEPPRCGVRFNVGILGYKNDQNCIEFLKWWGNKCIEWCEWKTLPDGRMGDQGYLNILHDQPDRFKNVLSCPHPGVNLAPWSIGKHIIMEKNGKRIIDGQYNLITYHYHEYIQISPNSYYPTGWKHTTSDRKLIYDPYCIMIGNIFNQLGG